MSSIQIKDSLHNGKKTSLYIEDGLISEIGKKHDADETIEADGKAIFPGLVNTHTHAAMTLMRGYADDLPLQDWLSKHIWPLEAKLTEYDVYWGTKLACLEMIKTGTTCMNDMYWFFDGAYKAAEESGIRAVLSQVFIDMNDPERAEKEKKLNEKIVSKYGGKNPNIKVAISPHAVYTVSKESLKWCAEYSKEKNLLLHTHLSETEQEVKDCLKQYGATPTKVLDECGLLNERLMCAHGVWLGEDEKKLLGEKKVSIAHCSTSNKKLAVGGALDYGGLAQAGVNVCVGTDGCASNNNLDMFEEIKISALLQKHHFNDPTRLPAKKVLECATINGAKALAYDGGIIREGAAADIILINLRTPEMTPNHNFESNMVYSASGSTVDTTIVAGKILMKNRVVEGEAEILEKAGKAAANLARRKQHVASRK
ncbi:MAG TPA: amidohydrolase [Candidatus Altiarchaeales archaeon]|mgnify:CR=1 FL=1|nr:amidohydrolase [Candidatus Altiarchaeales archaeon]